MRIKLELSETCIFPVLFFVIAKFNNKTFKIYKNVEL